MDIDNRLSDRTTRPSSVHWALQRADGASTGVCSQRHGQQLSLARGELAPTVRLDQPGSGALAACTHCGWCGDLVAEPVHCTVHAPHGCPEFDPFATEAAQQCVALLSSRLGESELPETFWHYLPTVARTARQTGQLHPAVLAELMWRARGAWDPATTGGH